MLTTVIEKMRKKGMTGETRSYEGLPLNGRKKRGTIVDIASFGARFQASI